MIVPAARLAGLAAAGKAVVPPSQAQVTMAELAAAAKDLQAATSRFEALAAKLSTAPPPAKPRSWAFQVSRDADGLITSINATEVSP